MTRVGCPECGRVFTTDDFDYCACEADVVALPTVADKLAFKLRMSGRDDEAAAVAGRADSMNNHVYVNLAGEFVADGDVWGPPC